MLLYYVRYIKKIVNVQIENLHFLFDQQQLTERHAFVVISDFISLQNKILQNVMNKSN